MSANKRRRLMSRHGCMQVQAPRQHVDVVALSSLGNAGHRIYSRCLEATEARELIQTKIEFLHGASY